MTVALLWLLAVCILYALLERDRRVSAERRARMVADILRQYGCEVSQDHNSVSVIQWESD